MTDHDRIEQLQREVRALRMGVCQALSWMGGSASSPLRRDEVEALINSICEAAHPTKDDGKAKVA